MESINQGCSPKIQRLINMTLTLLQQKDFFADTIMCCLCGLETKLLESICSRFFIWKGKVRTEEMRMALQSSVKMQYLHVLFLASKAAFRSSKAS